MQTRLSIISPDLVNEINNSSESQKKKMTSALVSWVLSRVLYADQIPSTVIEAEEILDRLDSEYFKLQEMEELGNATQHDVISAFSKARAVNSVLFFMKSDIAEAVYEAVMATDDLPSIYFIVKSGLAK